MGKAYPHHEWLPDRPFLEQRFHPLIAAIEAVREADHHRLTDLLRGHGDGVCFFQRQRHRFFQQQRGTGLQCGNRLLCMKDIRRADGDEIRMLVCKHLTIVRIDGGDGEIGLNLRQSRRLRVHPDDPGDFFPLRIARQVQMLCNRAAADHRGSIATHEVLLDARYHMLSLLR